MGRRYQIKGSFMRNNRFASGMGFYKLFWIFLIGCIGGVVVETLWCLLTRHRLESRAGLIYGPFNPVYGFGALIMSLCLWKLSKKRDLWIFIGSMVIGGVFEYLCSVFQEYVFGTVSWDYPQAVLGINGRTSLLYCLFWGVLGLLWVKDLMPRMSGMIERIPKRVGVPMTWVLLVVLVLDMGISSLAVARQTARRAGDPADNMIEEFLDRHYTDEYLARVYPNMVVINSSRRTGVRKG